MIVLLVSQHCRWSSSCPITARGTSTCLVEKCPRVPILPLLEDSSFNGFLERYIPDATFQLHSTCSIPHTPEQHPVGFIQAEAYQYGFSIESDGRNLEFRHKDKKATSDVGSVTVPGASKSRIPRLNEIVRSKNTTKDRITPTVSRHRVQKIHDGEMAAVKAQS